MFGVPHEEMDEQVEAVVEVAVGHVAGPQLETELEAELIAFARRRLAPYMIPRSVVFIDEMPRLPTGKLYKRILRDRYWQQAEAAGG